MLRSVLHAARDFGRACKNRSFKTSRDHAVLVTALGLFAWIFTKRNKLVVTGATDVRLRPYDIVVPLHTSLLDHFMLMVVFNWMSGDVFRDPSALIAFFAEKKNFFGSSALDYCMRISRVIPVYRDAKDRKACNDPSPLEVAERALTIGPIGIYPEGTRIVPPHRAEKLEYGVGALASGLLDAGTPFRIIPVWYDRVAMRQIKPYVKARDGMPAPEGWFWSKIRETFGNQFYWLLYHAGGHTLRVVIGQPLTAEYLAALVATERSSRRAITLTKAIMEEVYRLDPALSEHGA